MMIIGLTGGMASGKSTVAAMLKKAKIHVIDADELAHRVSVAAGPVLTQISERFGKEIINPDGSLHRKLLASIVFKDLEALRDLENIIHPAIEALRRDEFSKAKEQGLKTLVYVAPLLFEKNLDHLVDKSILITAPLAMQIERIMKRDGLTKEEAELRIAAQMSTEEKKLRADEIIENNGTLDELFFKLQAVWKRLCETELTYNNLL